VGYTVATACNRLGGFASNGSGTEELTRGSQESIVKSSDLFVKALESEHVDYMFGIPGEENLDLLDSLSRSDSIKLILTRHEQAAGFMAAT
jgi:hypothetical protein